MLSPCVANLLLSDSGHIDSHLMIYHCDIPGCGRRLCTLEGLKSHKTKPHNIPEPTKKDDEGSPHSADSSRSNEAKADGPDVLLTTILLSRYREARTLLRHTVMMDCDPRKPDNLNHLREASKSLKEMAQICLRLSTDKKDIAR